MTHMSGVSAPCSSKDSPTIVPRRLFRGTLALFLTGALAGVAGTPANLEEALQAQQSLVAESPHDVDLLNDLGNLLALAGRLEAAEESYRRVLQIDAENVTCLYNLALMLQEQDRTKEARKILKSIVEIDPQHAWAHYQLGTLYASLKDRRKALEHYERAFALDRSLTSPRVNPHIVENRLVTEALLELYVLETPSTQAPRIYQEPGHVADLLLPSEPEETADEEVAGEGAAAEDSVTSSAPSKARSRRVRATYQATPEPALETDEEEPAEKRVLDESTLTTRQYQSRESQSAKSTSSSQPSGSGLPETSSAYAPEDSTSGSDDTFDQPTTFIPGVQSTGRLDIELLPALESDPTATPS